VSHPQDLSLVEQAGAIARGDLDPSDVLEATLARLAERDGPINSTPVVFESESRAMLASAPHGPLYGVPLTVKDMYALPWRAARNGTAFDLMAATTSSTYRRLRDAGAVIVGVANQHEFGVGTTGDRSAYGRVANPWNHDHCPGGSSSGGAAAVAARLVGASLASDSGGSTRLPASYCGVTGLKVTYGALAYDGYFGASTTFSAPGVLARDTADARLLAGAVLGRPLASEGVERLRVGLLDPYWDNVDPAVASACRDALDESRWDLSEVRLTHAELAAAASIARLTAEIPAPEREVLASLAPATRALVIAAQLMPAGLVPLADRVRAALRQGVADLFSHYDLLATPTTPTSAPLYDQPFLTLPAGPVPVDSANMRQACLANVTGQPAISVSVGRDANGLPMGLQLFAPWGREELLLNAAAHLEVTSERRHFEFPS
jgi:Asp-tRNA(Asn)/Glu-tRNA(Gln) amidotransferase A subunit family amidase